MAKPNNEIPHQLTAFLNRKKAVFLDRDGVISSNRDHYYLTRVEDFRFNPGVVETLSRLKEMGYVLIVITNQGGISLGKNSVENVDRIHEYMRSVLRESGIEILEIYYCPHHSDNEECLCRKPLPLMLEKAMARFGIDPDSSWFIGDSQRDVDAGEAAGIRTILVESNGDLRLIMEQIG